MNQTLLHSRIVTMDPDQVEDGDNVLFAIIERNGSEYLVVDPSGILQSISLNDMTLMPISEGRSIFHKNFEKYFV